MTSRQLLLSGALRLSAPNEAERTCAHCGTPLVRKRNEYRYQFMARRYCSIACSNRSRVANQDSKRDRASETKTCIICGKPFGRWVSATGKRESVSQFRARQTCSRACGSVYRHRKAKGLARPEPGPEPGSGPAILSEDERIRVVAARVRAAQGLPPESEVITRKMTDAEKADFDRRNGWVNGFPEGRTGKTRKAARA